MNQEYLLDAIGLLDDDLIQEAERFTVQKRRPSYGSWTAWAAMLAIVIVLGYGATHIRMGSGNTSNSNANNNASGNAPSASNSAGIANEGQNGGNGMPSMVEPSSGDQSSSVGASPSDNPSAPEGDWCAAIMVDGVLYWSTDTPIPVEVDESVIRTVSSYTDARPEEDGQTNFDQSLTTQYAMTDLGLVVLMDNEWVLFDPVPPWER